MSEVATIYYSNGSADIVSGDIDTHIANAFAADNDYREVVNVERQFICDMCQGKGEVHNKRKCRKAWHTPGDRCMVKCPDCV